MWALGYDASESDIIARHMVNSAACGRTAGLGRILVVAEHIREHGLVREKPTVRSQTDVSVALDGKGGLGYLYAHEAVRRAIETAQRRGIGIATMSDIYYAGNLAYYAEMATRSGLIAMICANTRAATAPHGSSEPLLGTNPIAFGFPTKGDPIILDIRTASGSLGRVSIAAQLGQALAHDTAFDRGGAPTRDPNAARAGSFGTWGGHRSSGLGIVAQLFGILAGSEAVIDDAHGWGFFVLAFRPDLLMPADIFEQRARQLAERVRASRPIDDGSPPRMPFEASARARKLAEERGIEVDGEVYRALVALCGAQTPGQ